MRVTNITYTINDTEYDEKEFWQKYFKDILKVDMEICFPRDRYYAVEYGTALPKDNNTRKLIYWSLKKELGLSGKELEESARKWYDIYTVDHQPYPFKNAIYEAWGKLTPAQILSGQFKKILCDNIKDRLRQYNDSGVCTLGLAKYAVTSESERKAVEHGENEYETV